MVRGSIRADLKSDAIFMTQFLLAVQAGGGGMGWLGLAPILFIFVIFYLCYLPDETLFSLIHLNIICQCSALDSYI